MKSLELDFLAKLNINESIFHPPSGEEFDAFLDLIVGVSDNGPLPLTAVENERIFSGRDLIDYLKAFHSNESRSGSKNSRNKESNNLYDGLGISYYTKNQVHHLKTSEDLKHNISFSLPNCHISETENFNSSKIFGEAPTPRTQHFFDPDELRSLDISNARLPSPCVLKKESSHQ
jgi:hypothetical protein